MLVEVSDDKKSGVNSVDVMRGKDGRTFISVDSLVEIFSDMADKMAGGPAEKSFRKLIDTFKPLSTYTGMKEANYDDGSRPVARRCGCGVAVIDARQLDESTVVVDADEASNGEFFVLGVHQGRTRVSKRERKLDGMSVVRLRAHLCAQ